MPTMCAACWRKSRWASITPRRVEIVELCEAAGIMLAVNQNMRYDQSVRACKTLLERGELGDPVLATIDMRAIPHWMPWQQRQGWVTLRIMSIHHLDTFRYWFGDPLRVFASVRPDPRTGAEVRARRRHLPVHPRICQRPAGRRLGRRVDRSGPRRGGGRHRHPLARRGHRPARPAARSAGPSIPSRTPSTLDFTSTAPRSAMVSRRAGTKSGSPTPSSARWPSCCGPWKTDRQPALSRPRQPARRWPWSMRATSAAANIGPWNRERSVETVVTILDGRRDLNLNG